MALPAFLTHILSTEIGIAYSTDHAPIYLQFSLEQLEKGKGYWRMPTYLLSDPVFVRKVENLVDDRVSEHSLSDPHMLWDYVKSEIRSLTIQYLGECHKKKLAWTAEVEENIRKMVVARDNVQFNPPLVQSYTARIALMQMERDELVSARNRKSLEFKIARKHYESNRPTKYYYRLPGTKYDDIK